MPESLSIQTEVVLEGDGGQGLGLPLATVTLFLGLNGLVQALVIPAADTSDGR